MDLIRMLLVYMSMLLSSSAVNSPALTPIPPNTTTPSPVVTATAQITLPPTTAPTATPTATPTRTPTLSMGDRGEAVRTLQGRLQELGYLTGKVDAIFGKQTKEALQYFQRLNNLSVDGIAGPKTYQKLYNDPNVVPAPVQTATPRPVTASVPVYYRNNKGVLLGSDTVLLSQGTRLVTPNSRLIPRNHTLISAASVSVSVDARGRAVPSSVVFVYQPDSERVPVMVPIYYRTDTNKPLATDSVAVMPGETLTIVANPSKVPPGYTLITANRLTVTVSAQGVASPLALSFIYKQNVVNVDVSVYYRNSEGHLIGQEVKSLGVGTHTITANDGAVPDGYTLQGSRTQKVTISQSGTVTPPSIVFVYKTSQVSVTVPVKYIDQNGSTIDQDTVSALSGQSILVKADQARIPENNVLVSPDEVTVTVSAQGVATPSEVKFTLRKLGVADIEVHYTYGNVLLGGESHTLVEGTHVLTANDSGLSGYVRIGPATQTVTVDQNGALYNEAGDEIPDKVVKFTYEKIEPTPEPTAEPTATPSPTPEPTDEPTATPSPTPEPTDESTATPSPTPEPTDEPTATPSPSPEPTDEPTATPSPTPEPTPEPTVEPTPAPSFKQFPASSATATIDKEGGSSLYAGPGNTYYSFGGVILTEGTSVELYGADGSWALIACQQGGGWRFGYVSSDAVSSALDQLVWSEDSYTTQTATFLINDPTGGNNADDINLPPGTSVTVLAQRQGNDLLYVEAHTSEGPARGFIPRIALGI